VIKKLLLRRLHYIELDCNNEVYNQYKVNDQFLTLAGFSEGYYMEKGSKFLAYAFPVMSEKEAYEALSKIKKDHPKARHYCHAFRLFPDSSLERMDDDGEPSGTAGRPILGQIFKHSLTNAMIIVVRYFGGTKLGISGLTEAYKTSASSAIDAGKIILRKVFAMVRIELAYEQLPSLVNHFKQAGIPIFKEEYNDTPAIVIGVSKSNYNQELIAIFHRFCHMDFKDVDHYLKHLNLQIEILKEEKII
jgi:uncharacterized YigZ family protein